MIEEVRRRALAHARRSLFSGIASLALPLSGLAVMVVMTFLVPSRYLYSLSSNLARIYTGLALLSPMPLAAGGCFFFIRWALATGPGPDRPGAAAALLGLALAVLSVASFWLAVALLPDL